jgi:hypothetical protein
LTKKRATILNSLCCSIKVLLINSICVIFNCIRSQRMIFYMKNWNKTGKVKAILLVIFALPNLIVPMGAFGQQSLEMILAPLIFGSIAVPLSVKFNAFMFGRVIARPAWNDNPLVLKRPLSFLHFGAYFFLVVGLSIVMGTVIKSQVLNYIGLTSISFGTGILTGIWLTLKLTKST